jgi:hypothetical protein
MSRKQVMTFAVLVAVLAWSTVPTVPGQLAAVAALLPSLGPLVQQIVAAPGGTEPGYPALPGSAQTPAAGCGEPS